MAYCIGIDLGTTNSCVSIMEGQDPRVIANPEGSRTSPSVISFDDDGKYEIGNTAKRSAATNPKNTVYGIKRLIGRKFDDPELQAFIRTVPYGVIKADNGDAWIEVGAKKLSPAEASAMILQHMRGIAEQYLGVEINDAVVTVPAYFNDSQRQATKDAGKIAGLEIKRIINEPTAAALAYGLKDNKGGRIAVFDLGGGTFDISILEVGDGVLEVNATNGDTFLGGEDFDQKIVEFLLDHFKTETGVDLSGNKVALQRMKEEAEKAKHELSTVMETEINIPFITTGDKGPMHLKTSLTRVYFEEMCTDLIGRITGPCNTAMEDAGLDPSQISEILLVGGATRMPAVQQKVREIFKQEPNRNVNPDEVVAAGAAIQGGVLSGHLENILLLDVTPLSLGVETAGKVFTKIIPKNTTIPVRKSQIFSTSEDNQPAVTVHVLQGEREMAPDNKSLARFELVGIPPAPRGDPKIQVTFEIDVNGILNVSAKDLTTGKEQSIKIVASSGLDEGEIDRMIAEAEQHKQEDRNKVKQAELRNRATGIIYAINQILKQYDEGLDHALKAEAVQETAALEAFLEGNPDPDKLRMKIDALTEISKKLAEAALAASPQ